MNLWSIRDAAAGQQQWPMQCGVRKRARRVAKEGALTAERCSVHRALAALITTHGVEGVGAQVHELGAGRHVVQVGAQLPGRLFPYGLFVSMGAVCWGLVDHASAFACSGGNSSAELPVQSACAVWLATNKAHLLRDDAAHVGQHLRLVDGGAAGHQARGKAGRGGLGRGCDGTVECRSAARCASRCVADRQRPPHARRCEPSCRNRSQPQSGYGLCCQVAESGRCLATQRAVALCRPDLGRQTAL